MIIQLVVAIELGSELDLVFSESYLVCFVYRAGFFLSLILYVVWTLILFLKYSVCVCNSQKHNAQVCKCTNEKTRGGEREERNPDGKGEFFFLIYILLKSCILKTSSVVYI